MNFFDAQDNARRATRRLVVVYFAAALLIVAGVTAVVTAAFFIVGETGTPPPPAIPAVVAVATLLLIIGSTLYKTARLSSGGGRVAADMGGTPVAADTRDPLRRRLRNVVEEMAIASGTPVPDIYVLEKEPGINAFAAGYTPGDAAVAVTRGTLETLDRDELQGVVAHEFSHILNGDMRLNIRMMGVLFGIMVISLLGRTILRSQRGTRFVSSRRGRNAGAAVLIGLGLTIVGWIGILIARIIKAAVSRQREYLADASAVQFTRQTRGIAGALKKIGGFEAHSYFQRQDPEQVSHMLFARGARLASLFATHPPLTERIRKLEPSFDPSQYPEVRVAEQGQADDAGPAAGFTAAATVAADPEAIADSIGNPGPEHVGYAAALRAGLPEELAAAAHSASQAYLLALALILHPGADAASRQFELLESKLGAERTGLLRRYHAEISELGPRYRLPLLEIAFPALRAMPDGQLEFVLDLAERLIEQDGTVDFREFCYYRMLARALAQSVAPTRRAPRAGRRRVRRAAVETLATIAARGHADEADRERAFRAGLEMFGDWAAAEPHPASTDCTVARFESALDALESLNRKARRTFVRAAAATVAADGHIGIAEAELLRAVCATLDCPLPPLGVRPAAP